MPQQSDRGGLDPMFQQRIQQAVQPVMANFRQQVAEAVRRQIEQQGQPGNAAVAAGTNAQPDSGSQETQPEASSEEMAPPRRAADSDEKTAVEQRRSQATQDTGTNPADEEEPAEEDESVTDMLSDIGEAVPGVILETLTEHSGQWLQMALDMGLDMIFSQEVRSTVQQEAREGMQALVQETFDALTDAGDTKEMERKTTEALDLILRDTLDSIFAGPVRAELREYGRRAVEALVRQDMDGARTQGQQAIIALARALVKAFQRHSQKVLRLLLGVLIQVLQEAITSKMKDAMPSISTGAGDAVEEQTAAVQGTVQERAQELRDKMSDAGDTIREQVEAAKKQLEERLKEGMKASVSQGTRNQRLGRPPSLDRPRRRPPPGRHPSRRAPMGRPPSGRPPSAK
jgi:hypothetical protein